MDDKATRAFRLPASSLTPIASNRASTGCSYSSFAVLQLSVAVTEAQQVQHTIQAQGRNRLLG